jgi:hypothetical protein
VQLREPEPVAKPPNDERFDSKKPVPGPSGWLFALAGFFAAFTACNELPATSLAVSLLVLSFTRDFKSTLCYFVPAAAIPVAGFFVTNYLAIGQIAPAYSEVDGPWYRYEGSYWKILQDMPKPGIDAADRFESKPVYTFHLLLGHHGLFSLTPIFLLALAGLFLPWRNSRYRPVLPWVTLGLLIVVVGFYIIKTGNYGGWTSGPRWLMWLTPFLLLCLIPCVDRLAARRGGRFLGYFCLTISVFSVSYPAWNPWRHPWLYDLLHALGWVPY